MFLVNILDYFLMFDKLIVFICMCDLIFVQVIKYTYVLKLVSTSFEQNCKHLLNRLCDVIYETVLRIHSLFIQFQIMIHHTYIK